MAGDRHLQEKGITKIITPAAGSASMTQWVGKAPDLSVFRFAANDGIQAAMVVEEAVKRKFSKVALLHDATNYGVSGRDDLLREIKKQGDKLQVVATEKFNIGDKDMTAHGNGALMPQTFIEDPITPKAKSFIEAYHKAYKVTRIPSAVSAAQGYDAVYLFAAAVKQAGSTDTHKIKAALEGLHESVQGVIATWKHPYGKWDTANVETHEAFRREHAVMGMVQDGRVVFAHDSDRKRLASSAASK
jgi:branched-chain amino acid transport system substrate-binding protein